MQIHRVAAFSDGPQGGNPAGVVLLAVHPEPSIMQAVARDVGFSETVFAAQAQGRWRVRYFSPEAEIPFCGHATIGLAACMAMQGGGGTYRFELASGDEVEVEGWRVDARTGFAAFESPAASHAAVADDSLRRALDLFAWTAGRLDREIPCARIWAGADHLLLPLASRADLAHARYDFAQGQALMREEGWVTILLAHRERHDLFHVRNAFAYGGVYEDPATGAAAAALAAYLRARSYAGGTAIHLHQGDDMGVPCRIEAVVPPHAGGRVRVSGAARLMEAR